MTDQERDLRCLERLQRGHSKAIEELYDRHAPLLYPMVLRIVRDAADAEDVLHEVWLQVWKREAAFDPARGTVAAWLVMLARRRALDRSRAFASRRTAGAPPAAEPPLAPADDASIPVPRRRLGERVSRALAGLPPEPRKAIEIAFFEGLTETEIAARLGVTPATVRSWTRQGLVRLGERVPEEERV